MPAPVYVVAAGLTAAATATYAFVRFVYEPHIAPALERLAEDFLERRRAYRRELQRQRERGAWHLADPVQEIPLSARALSGVGDDGDSPIRHAGVKRKGTSESNSTTTNDDGGNKAAAGECLAFSLGIPNLGSGAGSSGVAIGLTPQEVNEWRNTVHKPSSSVSLRQRKSRVVSAKSGADAPENCFNNAQGISTVWSVDHTAQARPHVLDEPNQPVSQIPISPTPATPSASKSPFFSTTPPLPAQASLTLLNPVRPRLLSDGPNSNRTSLSFADSGASAFTTPSTLGLGLRPVFVAGEPDSESVRGSVPSTTTPHTVTLADFQGHLLPPSPPDRRMTPMMMTTDVVSHRNPNPNPNPISIPIPNPNSNTEPPPPILSLSQSYPVSLDYEQGIELLSHPSSSSSSSSSSCESESASSDDNNDAFNGSGLGTPSDRPSSPELILMPSAQGGAASPFVQLSPPSHPLLALPGSLPAIRQVMDEAHTARSTVGSPHSTSSPTMFYSFTDDRQTVGQSVTREQPTPDLLSPMLSELEFSSDDGHTSSFASNDDFGSESSWMSARV